MPQSRVAPKRGTGQKAQELSMSSEVTYQVRRAGPADAEQLARLRFAFRAERTPAVEDRSEFLDRCRLWMEERLGSPSGWRCWTAVSGPSLIGTLWMQLIEKLPNPAEERELHGYVSSVYVIPEYRNAGVGSALLDACLTESDRAGVDSVFLWSTPGSRRLYQRKGFAVRDDLLDRRAKE
jgi:GNAT superfamily N-acetyltransferase